MPGYANVEAVESLSTWFVRNDRPVTAWANAIGMLQCLAGLRGLWPMAVSHDSGYAFDVSSIAEHLPGAGNPMSGLAGLAPYCSFDGTGDYFACTAGSTHFNILGTEATVETAYRGLTLGGWFYVTSLAPGHDYGLIGKWNQNAVNQRSYRLYWSDADNCAYMAVSTNGTAVVQVQGAALTVDAWHHIVGRFDPSTSVDVWVDGVKASTVAGVPASLFSSTAYFAIGAYDNGATGQLHGRASLCWLSAMALPDAVVGAVYQHSRYLFSG